MGEEPGKARDVVAALLTVTRRLDEMATAGAYHSPLTPGTIRITSDGVEIDTATPPEPGKTLVVSESKYLAPECLFSRPVEPKAVALSDIYSLGFMAYEWLLGQDNFAKQFPFENMSQDNIEWMRWHGDRKTTVAAAAGVCPWLPSALSQLIERMLCKDAGGRPESYQQLITELEEIHRRVEDTDHIATVPSMEGLDRLAQASSLRRFFPAPMSRSPAVLLIALVIVLAAIAVFLLVYR